MSGKKVLVTGAAGMLGSNLMSYLEYQDITPLSSDITNLNDITNELASIKPDIIIHTAAYTNVEECETQKDKAYKINALGTQNLVNYCVGKDILFIYISSTGIYGTNKKGEAYNEFDEVIPTTIHHKSKFEGENIVQDHLNKYLIIRTGWLYGGTKQHAKNFVYKRYLEANKNNSIYSDSSQIGNPTFVLDLIKQINVLIDNEQYGVFNCVNKADQITRFTYVQKIIELFELECEVKVASEDMFKRIAPVSKNESAFNYKLDLLNLNVMGEWENSLAKYIKILKSELDG